MDTKKDWLADLFERGHCVMVSRNPVDRRVASVLIYYHQAGRLTPLTTKFDCSPSSLKERILFHARQLELTPAPPPSSMPVQLRIARQVDESMDPSEGD